MYSRNALSVGDRYCLLQEKIKEVIAIKTQVITTEESYRSKASFLSLDYLPTYGDDGANKVKLSGYR